LLQCLLCVCKAGKRSEKQLKSEAKYVVRCKNDFNRAICWSCRLKERLKPVDSNNSPRGLHPSRPPEPFLQPTNTLAKPGEARTCIPHPSNKQAPSPSEASQSHQKKTWLRRKPAQPQGLEVRSRHRCAVWRWSPSCCWEILMRYF